MDAASDEWVRRVLGVDVARAGHASAAARSGLRTLPIWQAARETVDAQIGELQKKMKGSGLKLFEKIADQGLNSFTQSRLVGLQVALMDLDAVRGEAHGEAQGEVGRRAAGKVRAATGAMRSFLSSPIPRLLDENRLDVTVTLRSSLTAALDTIEQSLGA